jgi:hypothetical protein
MGRRNVSTLYESEVREHFLEPGKTYFATVSSGCVVSAVEHIHSVSILLWQLTCNNRGFLSYLYIGRFHPFYRPRRPLWRVEI